MVSVLGALGLCVLAQALEFDVPALAAKALVDPGDPARVQRVIDQSRRGEPVTIAVIGGSITAGAKATKAEWRYGNRLAAWWQEQFANSQVTFHNAGIGATGSNYGAMRCRRDLLSHRPDLVIVEYAVNDGPGPDTRESVEGLVRQILAEPQQPAVIMLFTFHRGGGNSQADHETVGRHYGLPMISFRDAVWPEIDAGRCAWEDVIADEVHPNDLGHDLCAQFIEAYLAHQIADPPTASLPIQPLPAPVHSDIFARCDLLEASDLKPVRADGFALQNGRWHASEPGSVFEAEIAGERVYLMFYRIKGPMGRATVSIDGGPEKTLEAWFAQTWGGYRVLELIGRDLSPGTHKVLVTVLDAKHDESDGHVFEVMGLGGVGVAR